MLKKFYFCTIETFVRNTNGHLMMLYIPLLVSGLLFIYIKIYDAKKLSLILEGFLDLRTFRRAIREDSFVKGSTSQLLLINTLITLSISVTYLVMAKYNFAEPDLSPIWIFGITSIALFLYFWIRRILFLAIGYFSEQKTISKEINDYNNFFYKVLGLVIFPILIFMNYNLIDTNNTWLAFFYNACFLLLQGMIILMYLIKVVQEFRQTSQIKISGYYLFLYFCTLEILPLIVLIVWFIG
jgi:hypothetical protein